MALMKRIGLILTPSEKGKGDESKREGVKLLYLLLLFFMFMFMFADLYCLFCVSGACRNDLENKRM